MDGLQVPQSLNSTTLDRQRNIPMFLITSILMIALVGCGLSTNNDETATVEPSLRYDICSDTYTASKEIDFDYAMQDRFGLDLNRNGVMDMPNTEAYAQSLQAEHGDVPVFLVHLFTKVNIDADVLSHEWCIFGDGLETPAKHGGSLNSHQISIYLPEGHYNVNQRVTVVNNEEKHVTYVATNSMIIDDIVIVAIGDSISSGEGNPELARWNVGQPNGQRHLFVGNGFTGTFKEEAAWGDSCDSNHFATYIEHSNCPSVDVHYVNYGSDIERAQADFDHHRSHRSTISWPAQVAVALERSDPHTSVTFIHLAASGASIDTGILGPYKGIYDNPSSLQYDARSREGGYKVDPNHIQYSFADMPSQIDQLSNIVKQRPVDLLLMSVGANDVAFGQALEEAATANSQKGKNFGRPLTDIVRSVETGKWDDFRVAGLYGTRDKRFPYSYGLAGEYYLLASELARIDIKDIVISQYMDPSWGPTSRNDNEIDGCRVLLDDAAPSWLSTINDLVKYGSILINPIPSLSLGMFGTTEGHIERNEQERLRPGMIVPLQEEVAKASIAHNWMISSEHAGHWYHGGHGECARYPYPRIDDQEPLHYLGNPFPNDWNSLYQPGIGDRWSRTANESYYIQGGNQGITFLGGRSTTKGTIHPNEFGHYAYAQSAMKLILQKGAIADNNDTLPEVSEALNLRLGNHGLETGGLDRSADVDLYKMSLQAGDVISWQARGVTQEAYAFWGYGFKSFVTGVPEVHSRLFDSSGRKLSWDRGYDPSNDEPVSFTAREEMDIWIGISAESNIQYNALDGSSQRYGGIAGGYEIEWNIYRDNIPTPQFTAGSPVIEPHITTDPPIIPPTKVTGNPSGALMRAFTTLEAIYGIGYTGPYRTSATNQIGGVEEELFIFEDGNPMTPNLLESWSIDDAGTKVTMTLKQDIPFQAPRGFEDRDFGVLDAAELVEWFNRSNATTNPDSTYGDAGDFAAIFLEATAVDEWTVEVGLVSPVFFCLPISQFGCLSAARGPHKVTTADTFGVEWARAHHVGTGPYVQGSCTPGDRCTVHAVESHWRKVGDVAEITGIQVPEATTQIAMLKSGAIDLAEIDYQLLPDFVDNNEFRFLETMPGGFVTQSIIFAGNLWEEFHARTEEPLNPWDSEVYAQDYPWLGDPWQEIHPENVQYTDNNNPAGMTDMEQARLVRLALSTAIDRNGINESLLNDIGLPIYSEYMGPEYPGWDASRSTGCWDVDGNRIDCSGTAVSVPWELPDGDLDVAGALLDAAGYPLVNGSRQGFASITLQAYAAEAGPVGLEVADAIMSDWNRLGIETIGLIEDYGGVISPRMRQRIQFNPVLKNGDVHSNVYPLDWPLPTVDTSSSRPGWGVGFESPAGAKWLFEILAETDPGVREAKHLEWVDYSMFWVQYAGVFEVPKGIVSNSRIASWNGRQQHYSNVSTNPEYIVLAD